MAQVLTEVSSVSCAHNGEVQTSGASKLSINGSPVLLKSGIDLKSIAGCQTVPKSASGDPVDITCTSVSATPLPAPPSAPGVSIGETTKLHVDGQPVILDTLVGVTNGMVAKTSPQPGLSASAGQVKLRSV